MLVLMFSMLLFLLKQALLNLETMMMIMRMMMLLSADDFDPWYNAGRIAQYHGERSSCIL